MLGALFTGPTVGGGCRHHPTTPPCCQAHRLPERQEAGHGGGRTEGWGLESLAPVPHLCGGAAERLQVPEATAPISVKTVSWAPQTWPLNSGTEASKQAADGYQEPRWRSNGIHTALQIPFKPANTSQKLGSPTGNRNQQGHHSCPWTELKSRRDSRTEDGVPGTTLSSLTGTGGPQESPRVLSCCCCTVLEI